MSDYDFIKYTLYTYSELSYTYSEIQNQVQLSCVNQKGKQALEKGLQPENKHNIT